MTSKTYINLQIGYLAKFPWCQEGWLSPLLKKSIPLTTMEYLLLLHQILPLQPWEIIPQGLLFVAWSKVRQWFVCFYIHWFFCNRCSILTVALCDCAIFLFFLLFFVTTVRRKRPRVWHKYPIRFPNATIECWKSRKEHKGVYGCIFWWFLWFDRPELVFFVQYGTYIGG